MHRPDAPSRYPTVTPRGERRAAAPGVDR